jgi:hypothetical protein
MVIQHRSLGQASLVSDLGIGTVQYCLQNPELNPVTPDCSARIRPPVLLAFLGHDSPGTRPLSASQRNSTDDRF